MESSLTVGRFMRNLLWLALLGFLAVVFSGPVLAVAGVVLSFALIGFLLWLPIHTLVRGRFAMQDRRLCADTRGWGRSVHTIQRMPRARVRNADSTMRAIVAGPGFKAGR